MTYPNYRNQQNKSLVWDFWQRLNYAMLEQFADLFRTAAHEDIDWNSSQTLDQIIGDRGAETQSLIVIPKK